MKRGRRAAAFKIALGYSPSDGGDWRRAPALNVRLRRIADVRVRQAERQELALNGHRPAWLSASGIDSQASCSAGFRPPTAIVRRLNPVAFGGGNAAFLIRACLGVLVLILLVVGGATGYIWYLGSDAMARAERGGWFEPAASDAPETALEQTIRRAFFGKGWDERPALCGLVPGCWNGCPRPPGSRVSGQLVNDINREEYTPSYSIESHLRRSSLNCHLQGRFSDLKLLRMQLRHARFNGHITSADEAAQALFGKPAASLDTEESIRLAATYEGPPVQNDPDNWARRIEYVRRQLEAAPAE